MSAPITYIADAEVDPGLDQELRDLLSLCFDGPGGLVFRTQRFYHDSPAHRWIIRTEEGALAAHVAVHDKVLHLGAERIPFGAVAEMAVAPDYRGRKYVKRLLAEVHHRLQQREIPFAALFGQDIFYASSGYVAVPNLVMEIADEHGALTPQRMEGFRVATLGNRPWPTGEVFLPGKRF